MHRGAASGAKWTLLLIAGAGGLLVAAALGVALLGVVFPFPRADLVRFPAATILADCQGNPLRMKLGPHDTDCRLTYHPSPQGDWIGRAVVAAEDQRFWSHPGIDPLALLRAVVQDCVARRAVSGASTLSTQVIRLMEPRRRTVRAKVIEMFRALQLERVEGKQAILEQYLNRAPFGANLVGIESASHRYFGKRASDLSLAEAALLAGMPQSPTRLRPDRFPERARKRQAYVLDRMVALGMITAAQRREAGSEPLVVRRDAYPFSAPHFCDAVLDRLQSGRGAGGGVVRTTLDPALQRLAERVVEQHRASFGQEGIHGAAVVVLETRTGSVRALVGSPDYHDSLHAGQVNGALAPRSAGSTLKPFAYALAMDQGRLTPGLVVADVPRQFRDSVPVNFDGGFSGLVKAREALSRSLNIPALTVVEEEGVDEFLRVLRALGLSTLDKDAAHYGLGLAIGNGSVRLLDLANAYACLARGGVWRPFRLVEELPPAGVGRRVFSGEAAWLISEMLGGDERAATTTGHRADARLPRLAWKTGTSSGFRDAWVVGYNPDLVIAVWVGNPDGQSSPALVGARSAVPLMWELVRAIYPGNDSPWFSRPAGVQVRRVCAASGQPAGPDCPEGVDDWAITGVSCTTPCAIHRWVQGAHGSRVAEVWPPAVAAFLERQTVSTGDVFRLISPVDGSVFHRLDGIPGRQALPLLAEAGPAPLYWFVDNHLVGVGQGGGVLPWPLETGRHTVVCCTPDGRSGRAGITVE